MRLLLFNLAVDRNHNVLGFCLRWIETLADKVDQIDVITMSAGDYSLPENVNIYSVGKEQDFNRCRRLYNFYKILIKLLLTNNYQGCFAHMMPLFAALGGPLLTTFDVPLVTWYAHRNLTFTLKIAHFFSERVVSVNKGSYPYKNNKLVSLGHGIDTDYFTPDPNKNNSSEENLILSVGRLSPIKDPITTVEAASELKNQGIDFKLVLVGGAPDRDKNYKNKLTNRIDELGLQEHTILTGNVPFDEIVEWYQRCTVHINSSPPDHSVDKAALEAMACGKPSLTSVEALKNTLGQYENKLFFQYSDRASLVHKIKNIFASSPATKQKIGEFLRQQVIKVHSLKALVNNLLRIFNELGDTN